MTIGFIGLGIMGEPMCENILKKSDAPVHVYDIDREKMEQLATKGAIMAANIADLGSKTDIVFTMVPKSEHVQAVYTELLQTAGPGQILADMSTIDPSVSQELAGKVALKGAVMLDAPVVKSRPAAVLGTLGIYVGGEKSAFESIKPFLAMMGNNIIHLGENGSGLTMKICHNMLVSQIQNGVNEMIVLARRAGISIDDFTAAVSYGGGQNFYLDAKSEAIKNMDFTTAFSVANMHKDILIAEKLAEQLNVRLPGIAVVKDVYEKAMKMDLSNKDFSASYTVVSKSAE